MVVAAKVAMILDRHMPDVTFIDVTGIGGPVGDRLRQLGYHVIDVGFGHVASDERRFANKTAEMAYRFNEFLQNGGALPDDPQLEEEATAREFEHDSKDRLVMMSKKDMKKTIGVSPDWLDSLYLTFAQHVPKRATPRDQLDAAIGARGNNRNHDYNPLDCMDS
jgi:hypothetical protein